MNFVPIILSLRNIYDDKWLDHILNVKREIT